MFGIGSHFNISGVFEISKFEIAGLACTIQKNQTVVSPSKILLLRLYTLSYTKHYI